MKKIRLTVDCPKEIWDAKKCFNPHCNRKKLYLQWMLSSFEPTRIKLEYRWTCKTCDEETRINPCDGIKIPTEPPK